MLPAMPDARRHAPVEKRAPMLSVVDESKPEDDLSLIKKVAAKDDAAFEALVLRYQDRVFSFCFRLLNDRAEAEDVAQDVFLTLYRSAGDFRGDRRAEALVKKLHGRRYLERLELDRGKCAAEVRAFAFADGNQERKRLGREPPRSEGERFG